MAEPEERRIELLLRFAAAGHRAGYSSADLEERVVALARHLGVEGAQISVTPTLVELSVGALADQRSFSLRVRPKPVDLDAIARLDDLVLDVLASEVDVAAALTGVDDVAQHPLARRWYVHLGAYGLVGAALAPILGGGWREVVVGCIIGALVGAVALPGQSSARTASVVAPVAALVASVAAETLARFGVRASPDIVTLAALVPLLPGMALAVGMRELASEHLMSGVANTAKALVQLLGLVFGVGVGRALAASWFGLLQETAPPAGFAGVHVLAAAAAGLAFTVTLRAQTRAVPVMCGATVLAVLVEAAGRSLVGPTAGTFLAALTIGIVGAAVSVPLRRPPLLFTVPGILLLVPGSAGFTSVLQLLTGQTVSAIDAGFKTFVTAIAIAYGLMLANVILPQRFTHVAATARRYSPTTATAVGNGRRREPADRR